MVKSFSHLLGDSGVSFYAAAKLAGRLRKGFPKSLDGAPLFLPTGSTTLRRALDQWFESRGVRPQVVAEFDDSALMKTFGQTGLAAFPAPTVAGEAVCRQYDVRPVGQAEGVRERFYAVSVERKLKHPAVVAVSEAARRDLFD
jgi:LysR family transcriptional activator of nhaA